MFYSRFSSCFLLQFISSKAVPKHPRGGGGEEDEEINLDEPNQDTGLFYHEYLMKVMKALETDPTFREQIQKVKNDKNFQKR